MPCRVESLPILSEEWQYAVDPDKGKQFATLKELMHRADVSEVVNACDAGREGELIFRFVYEVAGCKKPMRRLWISSMEDGAIKAGFASLKDGQEYDALLSFVRNSVDLNIPPYNIFLRQDGKFVLTALRPVACAFF